jgi:hypothetical protein
MSNFDWRSPETYAKMQTAEAADFAWEYLRRSSDYRSDYNSLSISASSTEVSGRFRERWGLTFRS